MDKKNLDLKLLGRNIRFYRKKRKLRQEDLADAIGVNTNTISRLENGGSKCSLDTLLLIARALKVSPDMLLKGNFDPSLRHLQDYYHSLSTELMDFLVRRKVMQAPLPKRKPDYRYYGKPKAAEDKRDNLF